MDNSEMKWSEQIAREMMVDDNGSYDHAFAIAMLTAVIEADAPELTEREGEQAEGEEQ